MPHSTPPTSVAAVDDRRRRTVDSSSDAFVPLHADDHAGGTHAAVGTSSFAGVRGATRRLATHARRVVEHATRATVWREPDALPGRELLAVLDAGGVAAAVLDARGTVRFASRSAAGLLGDASGAAPAWSAVRAAVAGATAQAAEGEPPRTCEIGIGGESYRLAFTVLAADAADVAPSTVVVIVRAAGAAPAAPPLARARLSGRQAQVADLLARGLTNTDIAAALRISPHTARHHTEHVFEKLGLRTRAALIALYSRRG
jgi:DNA-binding CsgD family transcriptional regulator